MNIPDMHNGNHNDIVKYFLTLPTDELRREKIKWEITASNARAASAEALLIREAEILSAERESAEAIAESRHEQLLAAENAAREELVAATAKATEATEKLSIQFAKAQPIKWLQWLYLSVTILLATIAAGTGIISAFPETKYWFGYKNQRTNAIPQVKPAIPTNTSPRIDSLVIHKSSRSDSTNHLQQTPPNNPLPPTIPLRGTR